MFPPFSHGVPWFFPMISPLDPLTSLFRQETEAAVRWRAGLGGDQVLVELEVQTCGVADIYHMEYFQIIVEYSYYIYIYLFIYIYINIIHYIYTYIYIDKYYTLNMCIYIYIL